MAHRMITDVVVKHVPLDVLYGIDKKIKGAFKAKGDYVILANAIISRALITEGFPQGLYDQTKNPPKSVLAFMDPDPENRNTDIVSTLALLNTGTAMEFILYPLQKKNLERDLISTNLKAFPRFNDVDAVERLKLDHQAYRRPPVELTPSVDLPAELSAISDDYHVAPGTLTPLQPPQSSINPNDALNVSSVIDVEDEMMDDDNTTIRQKSGIQDPISSAADNSQPKPGPSGIQRPSAGQQGVIGDSSSTPTNATALQMNTAISNKRAISTGALNVPYKRTKKDADPGDPETYRIFYTSLSPNTFKLDNPTLYQRFTAVHDDNLMYFGQFFARNFNSTVDPILNGATYSNPISFDIVHLLNIGKMLALSQNNTYVSDIVIAMDACETLYPAVPAEKWMNAEDSRTAVGLYGSVLFTQQGGSFVSGLSTFLQEVYAAEGDHILLPVKTALSRAGYATLENLYPSIHYDQNLRRFRTATADMRLLSPDIVIALLNQFITHMIRITPSDIASARALNLISCHMGIAKIGEATAYSRAKIAQDVKLFTTKEIIIEQAAVESVYKYGKTYINEDVAYSYFKRLYNYIDANTAINFKNLHKYTAFTRMAGLRFITTAIVRFPSFPWEKAYSKLPSDFNTFYTILKELWCRPYIAFQDGGIPAEFGHNKYKAVGYLGQQLLILKGGELDQKAKDYRGYERMSDNTKSIIKELIEMYEYQILNPINSSSIITTKEARYGLMTEGTLAEVIRHSHAHCTLSDMLSNMPDEGTVPNLVVEALESASAYIQTDMKLLMTPIYKELDINQKMSIMQMKMMSGVALTI